MTWSATATHNAATLLVSGLAAGTTSILTVTVSHTGALERIIRHTHSDRPP